MIEVHPLSPERTDDWLAFFDGPGFADNPEWRPCYCMFFHYIGTNDEWQDFCDSGRSRDAQIERIKAGTTQGYLAYENGHAVGWVNAAPRVTLPKLDGFCPIEDREDVGNVVCFVIASTHRRRGVARALLDAACEGFAKQGLSVAEAFPPREAGSDAHNYRGPLSLYETSGFTVEQHLPKHFQVRKRL